MLLKVKRALLAMQRHSWEQGVAMQAFWEMGDEDVVLAMAKEAACRRLPDGRAAMIGAPDAATDPCAVGETLAWAARRTGDPELKEALGALLGWALRGAPRNARGVVYHLADRPQFWVDSMYMLPPFLAATGHPEEALAQIEGYWQALYDPGSGLMGHKWDDGASRLIRAAHWGTGNGWTLAGLARVIDLLPEAYGGARLRLINRVCGLAEALLRHRRADGFFYDVVDDPFTFVETNLSQMLAYTLYRGVRAGWLPETFLPHAISMRTAAHAQVDDYGLVRGVCGAPTFDKPGVSPEGQAFFLLMEAAAKSFD